ncbi:hypothetical protein DYI37_03235 [Fulvimarina endophytica]|uniref:Uncharacterized protein n=1 Tax=Fulvimarina endophytica TaxID=2293836 RepID=A0A371XB78_9HYPH|nr:hypothetical protein [Fulvimarina endophytica]RFC66469.1 hypothetical protein DYI37_03235 [Fulvimarina endophytica]
MSGPELCPCCDRHQPSDVAEAAADQIGQILHGMSPEDCVEALCKALGSVGAQSLDLGAFVQLSAMMTFDFAAEIQDAVEPVIQREVRQ